MRSVSSMPAIVPWVIPIPESPVAIRTFGVVLLCCLVVFASDDQHVVASLAFFTAARFAFSRHALDSHVMIRVERVPVERLRDCAARHARADDIREIGSLLGVYGEAVVDRSVGRHDDRAGSDGCAVT